MNQTAAALGLVVILVGCAIQAVAALLYLGPLAILTGSGDMAANAPIAMSLMTLSTQAFNFYLVFFGSWC